MKVTFVETIKKSKENFYEISSNFFYLKDVNYSSQNSRDNFVIFNQITGEISKYHKYYIEEVANNQIDKFEVIFQ